MSKRELGNLSDTKSEGKRACSKLMDWHKQLNFTPDFRSDWTATQWHTFMKVKLDMEKSLRKPVTTKEVLAEQAIRSVIHTTVSRAIHKVIKKRVKAAQKAV